MINQIAYMVTYNDKRKISSKNTFTDYIYNYERGKLFDLLKKGYDNSIFFIGETKSKFNDLFFNMGFLYNILKENNYIGIVKLNTKEFNIKSFGDYISIKFSEYFNIKSEKNINFLNIESGGKKYSLTYISCDKTDNYMDILQNFIILNLNNSMINVSFIYELDSLSYNLKKILKINENINSVKLYEEKYESINEELIDSDKEKKKIVINEPKLILSPRKKEKLKPLPSPYSKKQNIKWILPNKKPKVTINIPSKPTPFLDKDDKYDEHDEIIDDIIENDIINQNSNDKKSDDLVKYNPLFEENKKILDSVVNMLNIIDTGNISKKSQIIKNASSRNNKIHEINLKLHKKIVNNFHRLKLSKNNYDIQDKIIDETIELLNTCKILLYQL